MPRGSISQSPGKGKKIAVFPYDVQQEADGRIVIKKVEIVVYMQSKYGDSDTAPKPVVATMFQLECEGEKEYGSDLDLCLKAMLAKLDKRFAIKWERWFLVKVEPARLYGRGDGAGCTLSWQDVWRGVTLDGSVLMRELEVRREFSSPWRISAWPEVYRDSNGKTVACVQATDANEAALEAFAEKLRDLTKTLSKFVAPENIETTLREISEGGLKLLGSK